MIIPVLGNINLFFFVLRKNCFYLNINRWGNSQVNTTTKPLFEETLDIILECFEKHKKGRPLLPIECLKNYQLIYNENNDT